MFSTSGGYHEYIGGIPWVHLGDIMSTSGDIMMHVGGYHEYIGRCSVHRGISWVHRGVSWVHRGNIRSTSGISRLHRGYHDYIGDVQYIGVFNSNWKVFTRLLPHIHLDIPRCTETPRCTHHIPPLYSWYTPDVLNIPQCTEHTLSRVLTGVSSVG